MMAMPDTVASSLWLSLVDMLVVFAVLAFLMLVCYGLKFFSRGSRDEATAEDYGDGQFDAAAGDEPAWEPPMVERPEQLAAMPTMVDVGHVGADGAISIGQDVGALRTATAQSRVFRITVNGKAFEVGVEQATGTQPVVQSVSQVVAPPAPVAQRPVVAPLSPSAVLPSPPAAPRPAPSHSPVSYTHLRAHETRHDLVCRLLLE